MEEKKKLPKLVDLYADKELAIKTNDLQILLNKPPKADWVLSRKLGGKDVPYIPISRVEWLLTTIFGNWRVEIKESKLIANAICVTVRLHVQNPISLQWEYQDGIGAVGLQTDAGAKPNDWTAIKHDSVMKGAPAAESFAIKDAAEKFGKLFGKDINRNREANYENLMTKFSSELKKLKNELGEKLSFVQDEEMRQDIINELMEAEGTENETIDFYKIQLNKVEHIIGRIQND